MDSIDADVDATKTHRANLPLKDEELGGERPPISHHCIPFVVLLLLMLMLMLMLMLLLLWSAFTIQEPGDDSILR